MAHACVLFCDNRSIAGSLFDMLADRKASVKHALSHGLGRTS
jgi:hypothetical protein